MIWSFDFWLLPLILCFWFQVWIIFIVSSSVLKLEIICGLQTTNVPARISIEFPFSLVQCAELYFYLLIVGVNLPFLLLGGRLAKWLWFLRGVKQAASCLAPIARRKLCAGAWIDRPPTSLVHILPRDGLSCPKQCDFDHWGIFVLVLPSLFSVFSFCISWLFIYDLPLLSF